MNRKIKVTSVAAAALASLILANANLSNEVKADTKPANTTAKAQTPEDAARANVASAQKNVETEQNNVNKAKGDLDQAKKDAEKTDAAYKAQSDKVDGLKKDADQKKSALTDAQNKAKDAQALVDEAKDPAKVKAVNDAVTKQEGAVGDAKKAKDNADQAVATKNKEVSDLNNQVQSATQNVKDKTAAEANSQKELTDATNALNGTGLKEANQKLSDAKNAKKQAEDQLNKDQNVVLPGLNAQKSKLESQIQEQLADSGQLKQNAAKAKQEYDAAVQKLAQLNKQIQDKKNDIQKLQDQLKAFGDLNNTINIGDLAKYKQAYKDNRQTFGDDDSQVRWTGELSEADKTYLQQARKNNKYQHSEEDKNIKVDPSNLTDAQITELSRFMADIINKVREQMGLGGKVEVTTGAEDFAKQLAQGYEAGFKSGDWTPGGDDHYVKKINEIAQQMGLEYDKFNSDQYYEDKGSITPKISYKTDWDSETGRKDIVNDGMPKNMDELKEQVYDTMLSMILPDGNGIVDASNKKIYEFGHASRLLCLPNTFTDSKQLNEERKSNLESVIKSKGEQISSLKKEIETEKRQGFTKYLSGLEGNLEETEDLVKSWKTELSDVKQSLGIDDEVKPYQVGAATSKYIKDSVMIAGKAYDRPVLQMHFITIRPDYIEDAQKFNSHPLPTAEQIRSEISQAKQDLEGQIAAIDEQGLKGKLDQANAANAAVTTAQQKLEQTKQDQAELSSKIQNTQHKIKDLQTLLAPTGQITKDLASAQATLDRLTASHQEKQSAYDRANDKFDKATQDLKAAQAQLGSKQNELKKAKQALVSLKADASNKAKNVENVTAELEKAKKHVQDLRNASTTLAKAKQAETAAQSAYDTAKKNLDDAEKVLNGDLKTNKDQADAKVATAQQAYDDALARLQAAKEALAKAQQALQDLLDAENAQSVIFLGPAEIKKDTTKTPEVNPQTKTDISTGYKKVRLTHNAFVYNKYGKVVKSGLRIKVLKRGKLLKALKNAKIVKINGKRYYQIGKNQFVKVANFEITTHAVHLRARIKGNKKTRAYDRSGKYNKHYARPSFTYTFNEKAKINGKTYYKIAGTNNWIPAKKLVLKK